MFWNVDANSGPRLWITLKDLIGLHLRGDSWQLKWLSSLISKSNSLLMKVAKAFLNGSVSTLQHRKALYVLPSICWRPRRYLIARGKLPSGKSFMWKLPVLWLTPASVVCRQHGEEEFSHAALGKTDMLACLPASGDSTISLLSCTQMNAGLQKCKCCLLFFTFFVLQMMKRQCGILISPQGCFKDIYA